MGTKDKTNSEEDKIKTQHYTMDGHQAPSSKAREKKLLHFKVATARPAQNFRRKKCETSRWKLGKNVTAHQF